LTVSSFVERAVRFFGRVPWLLPLISFIGGWIGFVMVQRGENLARLIALLALVGWVWLLIEPFVRRALERRRERLGKLFANFVSQSLQQELLFFSLPLLIGATQRDAGQLVFTGLVGIAAVLSTIDPIYERYIARRAPRRLVFHAYCSWIAALVVLPMVLLVPLERALPISLLAVAAWLLLTLPLSLRAMRRPRAKIAWLVGIVCVPLLLWEIRAQVPAAGLAVTEARITQSLDGLTPGEPVRRVTRAELERGIVAFAAIRAPAGLAQEVIFEWRHAGERERIVARIQGGKGDGFRTFSRKQVFPQDAAGVWTVDIITPQEQLLKRLQFVVDG
jgi:hypothetical protein